MSRINHYLCKLQEHAPLKCILDGHFSYTYAELLGELERWEARLDRSHIGPGAVVGIRSDYSIGSVAVLLALLARRSVAALIPEGVNADQYLSAANASVLLDLDVGGDHRMQYRKESSHPLLDQLQAAGEGGLIIFTSGSTGQPKAALHSGERFLLKFQKPGRRFRTLAFLLFDHVAGLDTLLYTLASGGTLVLARRRDPQSIVNLIESAAVEVVPASPSFLRLLRISGCADKRDLSSLKVITYGADLMDPVTLTWLNERFPNLQIIQKYGTTEIGSPKSHSRGNSSLWLKIKDDSLESKVVDQILWIRSPGAMLGYLNAASPVDDDGWYCTGDMVELDGEWIRFCGRAANILKVGGEKVSPAEVEQSIRELDFVREVVVTGEANTVMGQIVKAQVILSSQSISQKDAARRIRQHCRQRLTHYKVPVKIYFCETEITTARQKIKRS